MKLGFQFHLRTLFAVVTIAAGACGYVAHEWRIVRERNELLGKSWPDGDGNLLYADPADSNNLPAIRRWLGDVQYSEILLLCPVDSERGRRFHTAFPEAKLRQTGPPIGPVPPKSIDKQQPSTHFPATTDSTAFLLPAAQGW
jgi:hypothetical protein